MAEQLEAGLHPPSLPHNHTVALTEISTKDTPAHLQRNIKRRKARGEDESLGGVLRRMLVDHQLGLAINFVLLLGLTYTLFPSFRSTVQSFLLLPYPSPTSLGCYAQGPHDLYLVAGWVVHFTGIRVFMLDYVLTPLAGYCGISKRKAKTRFAEQSYLFVYYLIYWTWGLLLFVRETPNGVNSVESLLISLWTDYPRVLLSPGMKYYYLTQLAFWIQQILVIHLEERRKDHYQMLTHHFVTIGLMVSSYGTRHLRVGNAILVCMDIVDLVFPFAKIMRYLSLQTACDAAFGLFVILWVLARHVCYLAICWSIWAHIDTTGAFFATYSTVTGEQLSPGGGSQIWENMVQPILRPDATTFAWNFNMRTAILVMLLGLQAITFVWLIMIIRVVIRVLRGEGADDSRSDDEGEDSEEEEQEWDAKGVPADEEHPHPSAHLTSTAEIVEKPRFIEVETSSEDVNWPIRKGSSSGGSSSAWKKSKGISSGLNLGDHKEILNRIGCLSEEQLAREREKREASPRPRSAGKR